MLFKLSKSRWEKIISGLTESNQWGMLSAINMLTKTAYRCGLVSKQTMFDVIETDYKPTAPPMLVRAKYDYFFNCTECKSLFLSTGKQLTECPACTGGKYQ